MPNLEINSVKKSSSLQPLEDIRQRHLQLASLAERFHGEGLTLPPLVQPYYADAVIRMIRCFEAAPFIPGPDLRIDLSSLGDPSTPLPELTDAVPPPSTTPESVSPAHAKKAKPSEIPEGYTSLRDVLPDITPTEMVSIRAIVNAAIKKGEIDRIKVQTAFYYPEKILRRLIDGSVKKK